MKIFNICATLTLFGCGLNCGGTLYIPASGDSIGGDSEFVGDYNSGDSIFSYGDGNANHCIDGKTIICHLPQGNGNKPHEIEINCDSVLDHMGQHISDYYGKCK